MYKIMIVEDDMGIASGIVKQTASWGYDAEVVTDFHNVVAEFSRIQPHLVLMDISLPFFNGYHWCQEIRKLSKVPIIFISSASDNMNIVMAMNMGADDFVTKPFDSSVLIAKIQALLRRTYDFGSFSSLMEHNGAILNMSDQTLHFMGTQVSLTKNEYKILETMMKNKGKVISRDKLMERLWESDNFVDENTLSVNVGRLRKKLDGIGLTDYIKTKFGVGYIIE